MPIFQYEPERPLNPPEVDPPEIIGRVDKTLLELNSLIADWGQTPPALAKQIIRQTRNTLEDSLDELNGKF